jgi:hypothetical protein
VRYGAGANRRFVGGRACRWEWANEDRCHRGPGVRGGGGGRDGIYRMWYTDKSVYRSQINIVIKESLRHRDAVRSRAVRPS